MTIMPLVHIVGGIVLCCIALVIIMAALYVVVLFGKFFLDLIMDKI